MIVSALQYITQEMRGDLRAGNLVTTATHCCCIVCVRRGGEGRCGIGSCWWCLRVVVGGGDGAGLRESPLKSAASQGFSRDVNSVKPPRHITDARRRKKNKNSTDTPPNTYHQCLESSASSLVSPSRPLSVSRCSSCRSTTSRAGAGLLFSTG